MEFDATFLISLISFLVFILIMNKIFYAPILAIMKKRQSIVEDNFNSAKQINEETIKQEEYHKNELEKSRNEARFALEAQMQKLKGEKSKTISDYKHELITNSELEKENLRKSALAAKDRLKENVVDIAKNISNILLGDDITNDSIKKSQIHIKEEQV